MDKDCNKDSLEIMKTEGELVALELSEYFLCSGDFNIERKSRKAVIILCKGIYFIKNPGRKKLSPVFQIRFVERDWSA